MKTTTAKFVRVFAEDECGRGLPGHRSLGEEFEERYSIPLQVWRKLPRTILTDHGDCLELLGVVPGRIERVKVFQGPVANDIYEEMPAEPATRTAYQHLPTVFDNLSYTLATHLAGVRDSKYDTKYEALAAVLMSLGVLSRDVKTTIERLGGKQG